MPDRRGSEPARYENARDRREEKREYRRLNRAREQARQDERRRREPEKYLAQTRVRVALKAGDMARPSPELVFHHPDYSRSYYGCWVTVGQHQRIHAGREEAPAAVDYEPQVRAARARRRTVGATHCSHGHEYTPENTVIRGKATRRCRECERAHQRRVYARKKAMS